MHTTLSKKHQPSLTNAVRLALGLAVFSLSATTFAQDAGTTTAKASSAATTSAKKKKDSDDQNTETITVTAQKRVERLQDVPMAVSVVNAKKLASNGQFDMASYYTDIPGLSYVKSQMSSNITLRGIGDESGIGARPTAGVVIDDVPYGSATNTGVIPDLDPADLAQIEVLKGPQGTLYGASSMGGLLKYVTVDPDTSYTYGSTTVGGSTVDGGGNGYNVSTANNVAVSDNLAFRVSAFQRQDPYYVKNIRDGATNESKTKGARIAGLWKANENWTIRASALFQNSKQGQSATVDSDFDMNPIYGDGEHDRADGTDGYHNKVRLYTLKVTGDLGWATFDAISGYTQHRSAALSDVGYTTIGSYASYFATNYFGLDYSDPTAAITNEYSENRFTQELRLTSPGNQKLEWMAGLFYDHQHTNSTQNFNLYDGDSGTTFTAYPMLLSLSSDKYQEEAIYANTTYHFTDKFDVQVGGRYSHYKLENVSPYGGLMGTGTAGIGEIDTGSDSNNDFTYSISPRYMFSHDMTGYLRVATGYRAGGSNGSVISGIPTTFKSDSLVSYEAGIKGTALDQNIGYNADVYYIDWSDMQLSQYDLTYGSSYTTNAGKAVSQGVELSGSYTPTANWRLTAAYSYDDAKLTQDIPGYEEGYTAYGKDGDRTPYTAKNTGNVSVTRYFYPSDNYDLYVTAKAAYTGDRYMEFTQSEDLPRIHLPSYTTVNLNMGIEGMDWKVNVYANNLTNEDGIINANRRSATTTGTDVTYGATIIQPRTFGVNFTLDY